MHAPRIKSNFIGRSFQAETCFSAHFQEFRHNKKASNFRYSLLCGKGGFLVLFLQYSYPLYMCFIMLIIRIHDEKLG